MKTHIFFQYAIAVMLALCATTTSLHSSPSPSKAQRCHDLFQSNRMEEAQPICEQAATRGDNRAAYYLAVLAQNVKKLFEYQIDFANQGNALSQYTLADMYFRGDGTPKNYKDAAIWYKRAALQGHINAAVKLAVIYEQGEYEAVTDYEQAAYWYQKAAESGNELAQNNLGNLYKLGLGVAQDYSLAISWYQKAAGQLDPFAMVNLGYMYENGYGVAVDYEKAVNLYQRAAKQNNAEADYLLSEAYMTGKSVKQDETKAFELNKIAAEKAQYDKPRFFWFRKSAFLYQQHAQYKLAHKYENGIGTLKDTKQAIFWYKQALSTKAIKPPNRP